MFLTNGHHLKYPFSFSSFYFRALKLVSIFHPPHPFEPLLFHASLSIHHFPSIPFSIPPSIYLLNTPSPLPSRPLPLNPLHLSTNPRTSIHINPIRTRPIRDPSRNSLGRKSLLLKDSHIPRIQTRTSNQNSSTDFHRAVDGETLCWSFGTAGGEPVHAVH